jgi:hypothetical protein
MKKEIISPALTILAMLLLIISRVISDKTLDWLTYMTIILIIVGVVNIVSIYRKDK